jgi:TPP-dependent pyruvate/acetoin dehydrogenase alpha subunit
MGTALAISESETDIHLKAQSYRVASEAVDGMDVVAVEAAARRAIAAIHAGSGPFFLECRTYRFRAHSMFDAQLYRPKAEVEAWKQRCPILRLTEWAKSSSLIHDDDIAALEREVAAEVQASVDFAEAGTWEPVADLCRDVTTPREAQ